MQRFCSINILIKINMETYKIGNWLVTVDGIEWSGEEKEYFIEKDRLLENGDGEMENTYDWLVHLCSKGWLTDADIYEFNSAFIYAMEYFKFDFSTRSFIETLKEQQKELKLRGEFPESLIISI